MRCEPKLPIFLSPEGGCKLAPVHFQLEMDREMFSYILSHLPTMALRRWSLVSKMGNSLKVSTKPVTGMGSITGTGVSVMTGAGFVT